jgi:hypothetical protein
MTVLQSGVPLTLLLDLQHPDGPDSRVIYLLEEPRSDGPHDWLAGAGAGA